MNNDPDYTNRKLKFFLEMFKMAAIRFARGSKKLK